MHVRYLALLVQSPAYFSSRLEFPEIGKGPTSSGTNCNGSGQTMCTLLLDGMASWLLIPSYARAVSCERNNDVRRSSFRFIFLPPHWRHRIHDGI